MMAGSLHDIEPVIWFFLTLVKARYRSNETQLQGERTLIENLSKYLLTFPSHRKEYPLVSQLQNILNTSSSISADAKGTGWRHNNDHADYRAISILPTAEELRSEEMSYLPLFDENSNPNYYLESLFRLLREDLVRSMKREVHLLESEKSSLKSSDVKDLERLLRTYVKLKGCPVLKATQDKRSVSPYLEVEIERKEKKAFWDASSLFKFNSTIGLVFQGRLIAIGTISERSIGLLTSKKPSIGICFEESNIISLLLSQETLKEWSVIQFSAPVFSIKPVLMRIQSISQVPFAENLLVSHVNPPTDKKPSFFPKFEKKWNDWLEADPDLNIQHLLRLKNRLILDATQKNAILNVLQNRVGLIQGPPGTGKSFCGALSAKFLIDNTESSILIMCYTNHAVDQVRKISHIVFERFDRNWYNK